MQSEADFLEEFRKEFPDEQSIKDFRALGEPPKVFVVHGKTKARRADRFKTYKGDRIEETPFTVDAEFKTKTEAESQVEKCKTWDGIMPETLEIREIDPSDFSWRMILLDLWETHQKEGLSFPMYLP